jgi:predicted aldo/keto reductase-like oxidoreductase
LESWSRGLPSWRETPGQINLPVLLWLHNLLEAWDLESYTQSRYRLLGQGSHWFPGANADALDDSVSEDDLLQVLSQSPWSHRIPDLLRGLRRRLAGDPQQRLTTA